MPIVKSGRILVTGASGYVGAWIVKRHVDHNYSVLVAMRSQSQIDFITKRFPEYEDKVTGIVVPLMDAPGAYDEAVKDVDGIIHCASLATWKFEYPSELIEPAIKSSVGILTSAAQFGKNVKRVIYTSSAAAIVGPGRKDIVYDESMWNTTSAAIVERDGKQAGGEDVYSASKTLAERAMWDFVANEKPSFDFTSIIPVWNFGPYIHQVIKEKGPGSSMGIFLRTFPSGELSGTHIGSYVDVRDCAEQHVLALSTPEAGGERITSTYHNFAWQDLYDILNDAGFKNIPGKETYGSSKSKTTATRQSNAKSLKIFPGFEYRPMADAVKEMGDDLVRDGFL